MAERLAAIFAAEKERLPHPQGLSGTAGRRTVCPVAWELGGGNPIGVWAYSNPLPARLYLGRVASWIAT